MNRFARIAATLAIIAAFAPLAITHAQVVTQQAASVAVPDSPAGKMLSAWLAAFNSGDSAKIAAYIRKNEPHKNVDNQISFGLTSRGFDLVSIEKNQPKHLEYVLKDHSRGQLGYGTLDVKDNGSAASVLAGIPPGARVADFKIDAAARTAVIEGAIAKLNESYVFPDVAKKMGDSVRARAKRGEYDDVTNGIAFAAKLTEHFQDVSHDKHLRVNFLLGTLASAPAGQSAPSSDEVARYRRDMESINCGFVKAEQLANNVGYLKFNMFADPAICGPTASAAMNFLANTDALVIDLRDNGGGDPAMVAYISSYLFSKRTHLNDLWTRRTNATKEYWTNADVTGKRLGDDKPVFVLTSSRTFSGGEEFTNNLKALKRATIVGETTGGGAHPVAGQRINEH
ncbi:MAG TPA: S41 family peptidase, partial [Gemmatimonadaceae bacterium]|nr:S41 family peptidase [Gemmatimonadaceae bacterium]